MPSSSSEPCAWRTVSSQVPGQHSCRDRHAPMGASLATMWSYASVSCCAPQIPSLVSRCYAAEASLHAGAAASDLACMAFLIGRAAVMHLVHVESAAARLQAKRAAAEKRAAESGQPATGELQRCGCRLANGSLYNRHS